MRTEFYRVFIYFNAINCCRWRVSPVAECGTPRASASGRPTPGGALTCRPVLFFFFFFFFFLLKKPKSKSKKKRENLFLPFLFFCLTALQPPATVQFTAERRTGRTRSRGRAVLLLFRLLLLLLLLLSACVCVCVGLARSTVTSSWRERITSSAVRFWIFLKEKQTNSWTAASVCA